MADQPTTPSGSRWEPESNETPADPADGAPADATAYADLPDASPAPALDDPAAEERRAQLRSRAILAGAATALTLGAGLTGFVVGHSTAGNGGTDFRPANFTGQVPGNGRLGQGQQGPPSFGDRDGDHVGDPDGDGNGGPGFPGGSGSSSSSGTDGAGTSANPT
ncbi:hypothetical protein [Nocardioides pocheonensis]|uniref:Uncharacterized protein n=1 Tax=Nocardioides pocheonensis TaxID=661485 RepID=A0A3N0GMI0_9ACTN|nr:hypothetical protein [Nocardioides pocheonensis]RNM13657.1 hypothetical protein EFL26_11720 [Nocardioides pocheonensis]